MLTALLVTILPTLLAHILLTKINLKPTSTLLRITLAWFTGMYFFTVCSFFIATFLTHFTTEVLLKATYIVLLVTQALLLCYLKDVHRVLISLKHSVHFTKPRILMLFLIIFCFVFSYLFFAHHVDIRNDKLYTTPIYWDFHWHAALISNFAHGDNFPPQNEAFSGLPHTYHYFWGVFAAIYEVAGLNLAGAINWVSILGFTFILLGIIGFSEELFRSKRIGIITVFLTLTSGSLHFTNYFAEHHPKNLWETLTSIFTSTESPWNASFLPANAFGYNGTLFNLYYFLEERQLIFAVVYLLLCAWVIAKRKHLSNTLLFWVGAIMGGFFLWHLHITIMVLCVLLFLLAFDSEKKKTLMLLAGFGILFTAHYLYFKSVMQSEWFYQDIGTFPRLDFDFASNEFQPFSLSHFLIFWGYSYGFKLILLLIGFPLLFKKDKKLFLLLSAIIIPAFLMVNTIQLSPSAISENHKWLRPMNIFMDMLLAFVLCKLAFEKKSMHSFLLGCLCLFFLSISGIIENATFFNTPAKQLFSTYPSAIMKAVTEHSAPQDAFLVDNINDVNLAGRKVFLGSNLGGEMRFKKHERNVIIKAIYDTRTLSEFCKLTRQYTIDFVEYDESSPASKTIAKQFPHFTAIDSKAHEVFYVDVKKTCR